MPLSELSGIELLRKIRDIDKNVYCIITAHWTDPKGSYQEAMSLGALHYFYKSHSTEALDVYIDKISSLLTRQ